MWIKKLRKRKFQSFMIFLITALCTMLLTAALTILISLDKPSEYLVAECNSPKLIIIQDIYNKESIENLTSRFMALDEVESVRAIKSSMLKEQIYFKDKEIDDLVKLEKYEEDNHYKSRFITPNHRVELEEGECFLPAPLSTKYGIKAGDFISFKSKGNIHKYKVKAIVVDPYSVSLTSYVQVMVKDIPEGMDVGSSVLVYGKEGTTGGEISSKVRQDGKGALNGVAVPLELMILANEVNGKILGGFLIAIALIVLLISCIIIRFSIWNSIVTDYKSIAVYKTIGYSSGEVVSMYIKLYLLIVSIGSFIGILFSKLISNAFLVSAFENMGVKTTEVNLLLPGIVNYTFVVTVVLLSIYSVVRRTKKVTPVEIFRGTSKVKIKKASKIPFIKNASFSSFSMALRSIARDKKTALLMIITFIMSIYAIQFSVSTSESMKNLTSKNYFWMGFEKSDVIIDFSDILEYDSIYEEVNKDNRVEKILKKRFDYFGEIKWQKGLAEPRVAIWAYDNLDGVELPLIQGRNPKNKDELVLSTLISKELNKSIGDYIDIYFGGKKGSYLITGTYQTMNSMGRSARVLGDGIKDKDTSFNYNGISIFLKEGNDKNKFIEDYENRLSSGKVIAREEYFASALDSIAQSQNKALLPFTIMILLIGGINIFNLVTLKNLNNRKSDCIYKSIGYSSSHLLKSNVINVMLIGVISLLITVPLFFITYPAVMSLSLSVFGFKSYPAEFPAMKLILVNGLILVSFIISCILSSRSLYKIDVKELNEE